MSWWRLPLAMLCALQTLGPAATVDAAEPLLQALSTARQVGRSSDVEVVIQDSRNFLWTAGDRGACRFDGLEWTCPVTRPTTLLAPDRDGGIWLGFASGEVGRIAAGDDRVQPIVTGKRRVTSLAVDQDNRLWVGTDAGLHAVDHGQLEPTPTVQGPIAALVSGSRGDLLVASGDRLLRVTRRDATLVWKAPGPVRAITGAAHGDVIVALIGGTVWRVPGDPGRAAVAQLPVPAYAIMGPFAMDREDRLWTADREALLLLGDQDRAPTLWQLNVGISTFRIKSLWPDREGNILWIASQTGLFQLRFNQPIRPLSPLRSLNRNDMVFSVAQAPNGDIWAGTLPGVTRWDGTNFHDYAKESGLTYPDVRSVVVTPDGTVWAGGMDSGVHRGVGGRFASVVDEQGKRSPRTAALSVRRAGGVWVGPMQGGLGVVRNERFETLIEPSDSDSNRVVDLLEARDGTLWVAGNGLVAWRDGRAIRYGSEHGLPTARLLCLFQGPDDALWIGTDGAGLFRLQRDRARGVTTAHGLDHDRVFGVIADDQDRLWISSPRGFSVVPRRSVEAVLGGAQAAFSTSLQGPDDGVVAEPMHGFPPSSLRTATGDLLFATAQGIVRASPRLLRSAPPAPVVIEQIIVDGQRVPTSQRVTARSSRAADVVVTFAAPTFTAPHRLRFRYKLEASGGPWTETNRGHVRLERLPHGEHRLLLQAYQADAAAVPRQVALELLVIPPWHGRTSVRLAVVAALGLIAARVLQQRRRRRDRTEAAIIAERARIAHDIHDGLEQSLAGIHLQINAAGQSLLRAPEKARTNIERAGALLADATLDLRQAIWKLQADQTTSADLMQGLERRLRRATDGTSYTLAVTSAGPSRDLPMGVAAHVMAVVREAVTNAIKHAGATEIGLAVDTSAAGQLVIEIADNGGGMDRGAQASRPVSGGLGMAGMQTRAQAMGGSLEVVTNGSPGTRVRLRVPLRT